MTAPDRATGLISIDLDAVVANWRAIGRGAPGARVAGVVKADAYGLGMVPVARALERAGCDTFFVATVDEGIELRQVLPGPRVFVLGGAPPGASADLFAHRLTPVLNSLDQVGQWAGYARARGQTLEAALHIDTGMNRLGLDRVAIAHLAEAPTRLAGITPVLVMSHMACADEDAHPKNPEQLATFAELSARLGVVAPRSLAASSTVFLGSDYHFDLVRPGAALYGVNPTPGRTNPMAPVVRLEAKILQVRDVDTPQTVGYGATHRVKRQGRIATVGVGYADGLHRSLGNRGFGRIAGERVAIVGRISMDLITFDVSRVPPERAHPGAMIELIGPDHPVDALAAEAGTIGYEILTSLSRRLPRHYRGVGA